MASPLNGAERDAFVVPPLTGRHVQLRPVTQADYHWLRIAELAEDVAPRWRHRGATPGPEAWAGTLWAAVLAQFIVVPVGEPAQALGMVSLHDVDLRNRTGHFSASTFLPATPSPAFLMGAALFVDYIFSYWNLRKLYLEVVEFNLPQFASEVGRTVEIEARLRDFVYFNGRYWDKLILAITRERWMEQGHPVALLESKSSDG